MEFRCPHCQAPIYSRKAKICGVCEQPLPPELLLSDEQAVFLKNQEKHEDERMKEFKQQLNDLGLHDRGGNIGSI